MLLLLIAVSRSRPTSNGPCTKVLLMDSRTFRSGQSAWIGHAYLTQHQLCACYLRSVNPCRPFDLLHHIVPVIIATSVDAFHDSVQFDAGLDFPIHLYRSGRRGLVVKVDFPYFSLI